MGTRPDVASRRSAPSGHVATTTLQRGPFSRCQKVPFLLAISSHGGNRVKAQRPSVSDLICKLLGIAGLPPFLLLVDRALPFGCQALG